MNDITNYLIEKLEDDLTKEEVVYSGSVLFSDLDRLCEQVVRLSPNHPNLYKEIYRLNTCVNFNWEDQHFDLVEKQTRELIEIVRKECEFMNKEGLTQAETEDFHFCVNKLKELYEDREYDKMGSFLERVDELAEHI